LDVLSGSAIILQPKSLKTLRLQRWSDFQSFSTTFHRSHWAFVGDRSDAASRKIGIPRGVARDIPIRNVQRWTEEAGVTAGPLFRSIGTGKCKPLACPESTWRAL
jgi:hypothetical protein